MRTENDLRDVLHRVAQDVEPAETFVPRITLLGPGTTSRRSVRPVTLAAAILVLLGAVIASVSLVGRGNGDDVGPAHPASPTGTSVRTSVVSRPAPTSWATRRSGDLMVSFPKAWKATPFVGAPATVASPLFYLSEQTLGHKCTDESNGPSGRSRGTICFNGDFPVPNNGLIIRWGETALPNSTWFRLAPGHPVTIAGHAAKVYTGPVRTDDCGPAAAAEISADISISTDLATLQDSSQDYTMTACLGPNIPTTERADVYRMLAAISISG